MVYVGEKTAGSGQEDNRSATASPLLGLRVSAAKTSRNPSEPGEYLLRFQNTRIDLAPLISRVAEGSRLASAFENQRMYKEKVRGHEASSKSKFEYS